jgi:hypothetical protein
MPACRAALCWLAHKPLKEWRKPNCWRPDFKAAKLKKDRLLTGFVCQKVKGDLTAGHRLRLGRTKPRSLQSSFLTSN